MRVTSYLICPHPLHVQVADNLVVASLSIHGTRSVQKIVEHCVQDDHVDRLVATLEPSVVDLSKNSNGNHVVQKCLKHPSLKVWHVLNGEVIHELHWYGFRGMSFYAVNSGAELQRGH